MNNVTIVSIRPPALNSKGDQLVLLYRLRALINANVTVHLILYSKPSTSDCKEILNSSNIKVTYLNHGIFEIIKSILMTFFTAYPLEARLFRNNKLIALFNKPREEIVIFYTSRVWASVKDLVSKNIFAELIDSYSLNYSRRPGSGFLMIYNRIQMHLHKSLERGIINKTNKSFVVSKIDAQWLSDPKVYVIPNGVDHQSLVKSVERKANTIGFLGNLNYGPNKRAVQWFIREVLPLITQHRPDARFIVAGNNPEKLWINKSKYIQIIGRVPSQFQFFREISVAVAPMLDGSGMQNKVLEAMSVGTPVVATSLACLPIMSSPASTILVGDTKENFANHILTIFDNRELSESVGANARDYVLKNYSWNKIEFTFLNQIGILNNDNEKI